MHLELGHQALWVWVPAAVVGILLNLQVQQLGLHWQDISGGTPNYTTRLLCNHPRLARYVAIGYYMGWISVPPMNAIILTDLINANLQPLGTHAPDQLLKIGFTAIPYIVAFSGTRALGILHLFFVLPAIGFLVAFCLQGMGWLAFTSDPIALLTPTQLPNQVNDLGWQSWAKWYFVAVYAAYGCETASSFVADSRKPRSTLQGLMFAAVLLPMVYIGGSWVMAQLSTSATNSDSTFLALESAAQPFWGAAAPVLVTFLVASGCLLSSATAVCNSPRILYQLARDRYIPSIFSVVSRRGVLGPSLLMTGGLSLVCLIWGDVTRVVMITGTGYLISMIGIHAGLWLRRRQPETRWPWVALGCCGVEVAVLIVGGLAWNWVDLMIGLLFPIAILLLMAALERCPLKYLQAQWWIQRYQTPPSQHFSDLMLMQVSVLILLVCGAMTIGWATRGLLSRLALNSHANLFVVLLLTISFVGVAIACWTSFPQVASLAEAREAAEHLFREAQDAIVVVNLKGLVQQMNPAAQIMLGHPREVIGQPLSHFLPELSADPQEWARRGEQPLVQNEPVKIVEFSISGRTTADWQEYVVILRDITDRKQVETQLRLQTLNLDKAFKDLQATQAQLIQSEKMSGLGQLVAGVAHEINNPINFIAGNLQHANDYTRDLLALVQLYQQSFPQSNATVQALAATIDLEFLQEDLPKLLKSMRMGVDRIQKIVLSLRTFSRMDEADMKAVDLHEGIDSTLLILQSRLKARGQRSEIQVVKAYGDLPLVECYAGLLNQVFMNILSNAIDALEDSTVEAPTITIRSQVLEPNRVNLCFHNNGSVIPAMVQQRLFDPFFTTKPVGKGTGLGLSISYDIVTQKHGGQLICQSTLEAGTVFIIDIPVWQPSLEAIGCCSAE
jgi:PAS domain S-box-containing protein